MELNKLTILQAHKGLKNKDFSSEDVVRSCIKQIKKNNKKINAFITVLEKQAIDKAKQIDKTIKSQGIKSFLTGIPLGIKDNILINNVKCTAGSKILSNYKPVENATVINKLEEQKAIFIGKTNMDEFAMGSSSETSFFKPVKNPINTDYVPGGSSGGSAASVKANMCLSALGTDTGGSIRQPSSFCDVFGLKPTYGRVSRYGLIAMASSLDQIGPIANCVDDLAILLSGIEGKDELDSTSSDLMFKTQALVSESNLKNIRIGVPKEYFVKGIDLKVKKIIDNLIKKLEYNGAKIIQVSLPHTKYALAVYYIIMPAEASTNLSRYDGIKYGYSVFSKYENNKNKTLLDVYLDSRTKGFGDEQKRRIMLGTYTLSHGYYEEYYVKAQKVRTLIKQDFINVFNAKKSKRIDCLLTPTAPTTAFKIGEKINDPLQMYLSDIYTVPVNLAGLPALSLPAGNINGLGVGAQLIGNYFQEHKILEIAKSIENM